MWAGRRQEEGDADYFYLFVADDGGRDDDGKCA